MLFGCNLQMCNFTLKLYKSVAESDRIVELRGKSLFALFTPSSWASLTAFQWCIAYLPIVTCRRVVA